MEEIVAYVPMEKELMRLTEVRRADDPDRVLKLTPTSKMLYRYMFDRYQHFSVLGKKFFDNQEELSAAIGVTPRTVLNLIKEMVEFGLMSKSTIKTTGSTHSNSYVVLDIFDKALFSTAGNGKLLKKQRKPSVPTSFQPPGNQKYAPSSSYEDIEAPF